MRSLFAVNASLPGATPLEHIELVLFGLLVAVAGLAVLARLVRVPYPILLVIGGLGVGLIPGVPEVELDPDIVLLIFLPPLLYAAAFFSNLRELRNNARADRPAGDRPGDRHDARRGRRGPLR